MAVEENGSGMKSETLTVVAGTAAEVIAISCDRGLQKLGLEIKNGHASVAFDALVISYRVAEDATYQILANADSDFTTPQFPIEHVEISSGSVFTTLPAGVSITLGIDVSGMDSIQIKASGLSAASTMDVYWNFI